MGRTKGRLGQYLVLKVGSVIGDRLSRVLITRVV